MKSLSEKQFEEAVDICRSEKPNKKKAFDLFLSSSDQGNARAIYALATWYLFGNDVVEKDEKRAVQLLKSISDSNIAEAIFQLAVAYDRGWGIKRNSTRALSLYTKAALLGDKDACDQVSQYYMEGKHVKFDKDIAEAWKMRSTYTEKEISPSYRQWMDA